MTEAEILDSILLGLADLFEAGNRQVQFIEPGSLEEYEPLRQCLASLIAEGSLTNVSKMNVYRLTPAGYQKYKPRIDALRALCG